jgi:glyoxylase-like metal-dependent hydrolase (beta-lactamase superfamily II)
VPGERDTPRAAPTIVNVGYRSTNFWVVSVGRARLMVDLGWPGMLGTLEANLKRMDIPLAEVGHGLATHYHMDHAGAAQDLKNKGMRLIVTPEQVNAIPAMKQWIKNFDAYTEIVLNDNAIVACAESRAFLAKIGFDGEIVHTPGHSDDSVSLVLDTGAVFTGDLTHPSLVTEEIAETVARSWQLLRDRGATTVYAGHGPVRPFQQQQSHG